MHYEVVSSNRTHRHCVDTITDQSIEQFFAALQSQTQTVRAGSFKAAADECAFRTNLREVEVYTMAFVFRELATADEVAGQQNTESICPTFDGVRNGEQLHFIHIRFANVGQLGNVMFLNREANAATTQQHVHSSLEETRTITVRHTAIVHTRFVLEDLFAAKLQRTLSTKDKLIFIRFLGEHDMAFEQRGHLARVLFAVHVHHTLYGLIPSFVATF